jgi:adenosine kinase
MTRNYGGTAGNISYGLSLLREKPITFTTVGKDFGGYKDWLEKNELNVEEIVVLPDEYTASAHIITDARQRQITAFHGGAMLKNDISLSPILEKYSDISYGIIAADGRDGMLSHAKEMKEKGIPCIYDPGHSLPSFDKEGMRELIEGSFITIVNEYEEHLLLEKTGLSREDILEQVKYFIVTKGVDGSYVYSKGQDELKVDIAKADEVVDPTGAGDAYRSGLLKGLLHNLTIEESCKIASLAACYAVERIGTQSYSYGVVPFMERFQKNYGNADFLSKVFDLPS